ncbi:hypothetical protein [Gimesia maris]|uniref:hypothetical protein n=1 Tax=Gimesia maris TaxID=122 RepID=UPI0032EEE7D3
MYLPDPIEMAEARCEDWAFENVTGDSFRCECGDIVKLDEAESLSPDPYAIPVCSACVEYYSKHKQIQKGES